MKQLSIVVDNKVGVLADITFILGKSKINIDSISVSVVGDKSVVTIGVKDATKATQLLSANGYNVVADDVLIVRTANKPGELAKISKLLADEGINIVNVRSIAHEGDYVLDSIQVDKMQKAQKVLAPYIKGDEEI